MPDPDKKKTSSGHAVGVEGNEMMDEKQEHFGRLLLELAT